jgi:hypothetical protein
MYTTATEYSWKSSYTTMYYDDPYDPTLENDYDDPVDNHSISSSTVDTRTKKFRENSEKMKKEDRGYHKISIGGRGREKFIEMYSPSAGIGAQIRNAVTGVRFPQYRVGTRDEDLFFKVAWAGASKGMAANGNNILFFDNPEHFERHTHSTLTAEIKQKWSDKNFNEQLRRRKQEE